MGTANWLINGAIKTGNKVTACGENRHFERGYRQGIFLGRKRKQIWGKLSAVRENKVGGEKHLDDLEQVQGSQNSAQLTHTTRIGQKPLNSIHYPFQLISPLLACSFDFRL